MRYHHHPRKEQPKVAKTSAVSEIGRGDEDVRFLTSRALKFAAVFHLTPPSQILTATRTIALAALLVKW